MTTELLPTPLKQCNRCLIDQPIDEFTLNKTYKLGRELTCKECRRADRRDLYRRNTAKTPPETKTCSTCGKTKIGDEFPKNSAADGRHSSCRECKGLRTKLRLYKISRAEFLTRLESQGGGCAICKSSLEKLNQYHVDHDHACCPHGESCGKCIRGLLCSTCNVLTLPGYEQMPEALKRCPVLNKYLKGEL